MMNSSNSSCLRSPWLLLVLSIPLLLVLLCTQDEVWTMKHFLSLVSSRTVCEAKSTLTKSVEAFYVEYSPAQAEEHIREFFYQSQHVLCRDLKERNDMSQWPLRVRYTFNCQELHDQSRFGSGNWLLFLYNLRRAANLIGHVELHMKCTDADEAKQTLILPWIMGTFQARATWDLNREAACKPVWALEGSLLEDLRFDLRRMAFALVGFPQEENYGMDVTRKLQPDLASSSFPLMLPDELDEVAVHLRCGDIIEKTPHHNYGYARFPPLADLISEKVTSIGIVTQDFQNDQGRCAILVEALQSFLQRRFQQAQVKVRKAPNESIALMYTRFILAQQVITAGTSAYMTMPFSATFGAVSKIDQGEIIDSVRIFNMWQEENGRERILDLLTSSDSR